MKRDLYGRKFDGKRYICNRHFRFKSEAKKWATSMRRAGWYARVVPEEIANCSWSVYIRAKTLRKTLAKKKRRR